MTWVVIVAVSIRLVVLGAVGFVFWRSDAAPGLFYLLVSTEVGWALVSRHGRQIAEHERRLATTERLVETLPQMIRDALAQAGVAKPPRGWPVTKPAPHLRDMQ